MIYKPSLAAVVAALAVRKSALACLQVGSFDGKTDDELYPLVRLHGIRYIGIEPQPEAFRSLQGSYMDLPESVLLNVAIGEENATCRMFRVRAGVGEFLRTGQLAAFDRSVILREPGIQESDIEKFEVGVRTLQWCLERAGVAGIDIAQVDCEGFDDHVVAQVLKLRELPSVIRYEGKHLSRSASRKTASRLLDAGYKVSFTPVDVIAVRGLAAT